MTAQPQDQPRRKPLPWDEGIECFSLLFYPTDYEAETGRPPYLELADVLPGDADKRRRLLFAVVQAAMKAYRRECQMQSHGRVWDYPRR